ncbi:hypothetical protein SCHIN_v1c08640 [Spiroplasma chinense]|uniref:Uncharacterized protein n=1 Tax=Spiroplasma chinense TaxID=216932 RepID=A0A5B9Y5S7_9MOLU|nr:hypothetical protein [Spiroplasma chinense]QEH62059.1 hypothetical protein SCHIN_v1c08640 [Spiroplasma chinense]
MKNVNHKLLFISVILIFITIISLLFFEKTQIYYGSVFVQVEIQEEKTVKVAYVIMPDKININEIEYLKIEYVSGYETISSSNLEYKEGMLIIKNIKYDSILPNNNQILLFGKKVTIFKYLISNLY